MNFNKGIFIAQIALLGLAAFWLVRAAIVFFTPQSAWTVFEARPAIELPNAAQINAPENSLGQKINISFDPFHRETIAAKDEPSLGQDAPETTLDLKLVGRRSGAGGTAILVTPDGKQKIYRIEDEILRGVSLKAVNVDYVVISQEGRLERLTFIKPKDNGLRAPEVEQELIQVQAQHSQPQDTQSQEFNSAPANNPKPSSSLRGKRAVLQPNQFQTAPAQINPAQNQTAQNAISAPAIQNFANPAAALAAINLTPFRENNRVAGYRVSPKQAGFDLRAFGLQNGDVITSIGGRSLQSESLNLGAVLAGLQGQQSASVNLIRNGSPISLTVGAP